MRKENVLEYWVTLDFWTLDKNEGERARENELKTFSKRIVKKY